jgi:tetratricopeptide (TPR) repeat protein
MPEAGSFAKMPVALLKEISMGRGNMALWKPAIAGAGLSVILALAMSAPVFAAVDTKKETKVPETCVTHADPEKQITACTDFLEKNPRSAEGYIMRGLAFARIQSNKQAIADFDLAIKLNPKSTTAYNNRGIARRLVGQNDDAIKDFTKSIEIDPKYVLGYVGRGISRMVKRDFDGSEKDFLAAIKIDPDFGPSYRNLGNLRVQQQRFQDAIAFYNEALIRDVSDADSYFNRAIAYEALRNYNVAILNYRLALKYDPQMVAAAKALDRLGVDPRKSQ